MAAPDVTISHSSSAASVVVHRDALIQRVKVVNIMGDLVAASLASSSLSNSLDLADIVDVSNMSKLHELLLQGGLAMALLVDTDEQPFSGILRELIASPLSGIEKHGRAVLIGGLAQARRIAAGG